MPLPVRGDRVSPGTFLNTGHAAEGGLCVQQRSLPTLPVVIVREDRSSRVEGGFCAARRSSGGYGGSRRL